MYLVYDTETNGFPPKARMAQLAFILYDENGNIIKEFASHCKPDGWEIPKEKFFIENNMSTERCEAEGIPVFNVLREFQEALKLAKYKIAHNHNFDNQIVTNEIAFAGIEPALFKYKKSFCTMLNTIDYVGAINKWGKPGKWPSLMELHQKLFECEFEGAHDALDDVRATGKCFFELKKRKIVLI